MVTTWRNEQRASSEVVAAWKQVHGFLLSEAALLVRARRSSHLTGAAALEEISKHRKTGNYNRIPSVSVPQVSLIADAIDEPDGERVVEFLDALDPTEALFYSAADHVVDPFGKSTASIKEIEIYYGFIGGCQDQYVR